MDRPRTGERGEQRDRANDRCTKRQGAAHLSEDRRNVDDDECPGGRAAPWILRNDPSRDVRQGKHGPFRCSAAPIRRPRRERLQECDRRAIDGARVPPTPCDLPGCALRWRQFSSTSGRRGVWLCQYAMVAPAAGVDLRRGARTGMDRATASHRCRRGIALVGCTRLPLVAAISTRRVLCARSSVG
jgi:hypothetical protein